MVGSADDVDDVWLRVVATAVAAALEAGGPSKLCLQSGHPAGWAPGTMGAARAHASRQLA